MTACTVVGGAAAHVRAPTKITTLALVLNQLECDLKSHLEPVSFDKFDECDLETLSEGIPPVAPTP